MRADKPITLATIFRFWATLAGTLLMMAIEPTIIISVVSRQPNPEPNLGAYGVTLAIGILCEGPVLRLLSASIAIVHGGHSYCAFRRFSYGLSALMSFILLIIACDPIFTFVGRSVFGLGDSVFGLLHLPLLIYVPAPFLVGYRRFLQGMLVNGGHPHKVTQATAARLATAALAAILLPQLPNMSGAAIGSAIHTLGMLAEAVASRILVHRRMKELAQTEEERGNEMSFRALAIFYYPLALSAVVNLLGPPVETYFLARGENPLVSLALLPVVNSILAPFSWSGTGIQDAFIALFREDRALVSLLRRFQWMLAASLSIAMGIFVLSPLLEVWLTNVNQLPTSLIGLARQGAIVLIPLPAVVVWKAGERGILVKRGATRPALISEILEIGLLVLLLWVTVVLLGYNGLLSVLAANTVCAILNSLWLHRCVRILDRSLSESIA